MIKIKAAIKAHKRVYQFFRPVELMYLTFRKIIDKMNCFLFGVKKEMPVCERIKISFGNKFISHGRKNLIKIDKAYCKYNLFAVYGTNCMISIGSGSRIENVEFEVRGEDNCITIGKNVVLRNAHIGITDNGSSIVIGDDTTIGKGLKMTALESAKIEIGRDCMFSTNVSIMNSDSHSIIDLNTKRRINHAMDVRIGNHVWLGEDVKVLKGVEIQDNVVIGNRSILTKGKYGSHTIYVGSPAKILRGGDWCRERIHHC